MPTYHHDSEHLVRVDDIVAMDKGHGPAQTALTLFFANQSEQAGLTSVTLTFSTPDDRDTFFTKVRKLLDPATP